MKLTIFAQWFAVLAVIAALGCGGESARDTLSDAASDVSARASDAANSAADAASSAASSASDAASDLADDAMADDAAGSDEAESCLGLVGEAKFAEAIPVCTQALGLDPSNTAVQQALEKAKSEATGGAADAAQDAAGGLLGR